MTEETKELVSLRRGEYARAAHEAAKHHVEPFNRADLEHETVCRCCGFPKPIPAFQHVCAECQE